MIYNWPVWFREADIVLKAFVNLHKLKDRIFIASDKLVISLANKGSSTYLVHVVFHLSIAAGNQMSTISSLALSCLRIEQELLQFVLDFLGCAQTKSRVVIKFGDRILGFFSFYPTLQEHNF